MTSQARFNVEVINMCIMSYVMYTVKQWLIEVSGSDISKSGFLSFSVKN